MDHLKRIQKCAASLRAARTVADHQEKALMGAVSALVEASDKGLRGWARSVGISAQYACDIRHGRRKISEKMLVRILRDA